LQQKIWSNQIHTLRHQCSESGLHYIIYHNLNVENVVNICVFHKVLVLILGSSSSDDVRGPSGTVKGSGVKTIAVGTDSSVPVDQLNIIATGADAVITITTIIKINTILQPVIDKINDGKSGAWCSSSKSIILLDLLLS
jgi:hypothetical protein